MSTQRKLRIHKLASMIYRSHSPRCSCGGWELGYAIDEHASRCEVDSLWTYAMDKAIQEFDQADEEIAIDRQIQAWKDSR